MGTNPEFEKHISSVWTFAGSGNKEVAIKMLNMLEVAFPDEVILLDEVRAKILLGLQAEDDITVDKVLRSSLSENFENNKRLLEGYELCYGNIPQQLNWFVIFASSELVLAINEETKQIKKYIFADANFDKQSFGDRPVLAEKMLLVSQMKALSDVVQNRAVTAIYFALHECEMEILLQLSDLSELLPMKVFVFLIEHEGMRKCFTDNGFPFPVLYFSMTGDKWEFDGTLNEIKEQKSRELDNGIQLIQERYRQEKAERDERIRNGKPRILFWACIDSYTIPYQARDEIEAARKLGCECFYMIEPDFIRRITKRKFVECILQFNPDVIFDMNRFRYENDIDIPDEMIYVTWIQDPWPNILDPSSPGKLKKRDILLNHLVKYRDFIDIYGDLVHDAPIPASQYVYKPYELSYEEKEKYGADLCLVCMCTDVEGYLEDLFESLEKKGREKDYIDIVKEIFFSYKAISESERFFYSRDEFLDYITGKFNEHDYPVEKKDVLFLADEMEKKYNQRLFRYALVEWMLEAGFDNIKLWGYGWKNSPKYSRFAMGPAENGEVLSKILQASKIVVGNNIMTTAAARAWECMLSGGFYISNYIPPDMDVCDIRDYMPEGSFEMFRDKEEFIRKIRFYIENEDARKEMAQKEREAALKTMTYDALMKKLISIMPEYI